MKRLLIIAVCSLASINGFSTVNADDNQQDIQVQARGPVHEGYAQPYRANPGPSPAVEQKPPDPIPEEPAAEKPAGKNVQWIPGYWQWDTDKKDFVWVSGIWRDIPDGRRWVPGYWANTQDGYRWVSGHFANAAERDNQYVPEPPQNPDESPATTPPDDSSSYVPGTWLYGDDGYNYRAGYWTQCYDDRVWVPSYYNWTPYGYEFCSGYWDYPFANRGLLFAPVWFGRPYWNTPGWYYRPNYAVGFGGLYSNLFVGFGYNHYYFGDYYARSYLNHGIYPWYWGARNHYDPIWAHQSWMNRGNPNWAHGFQSNYIARVNGQMPLPPRTLAAQRNLAASGRFPAGSPRMVQSLNDARNSGMHLQTVSHQQHLAQTQSARTMMNQSRSFSQSAPRVAVTQGPANFNRGGSSARIGTTGSFPSSQATMNNRSFAGSTSRQGAVRITTPSGSQFSSPRFNSPSMANRSYAPSSLRYGNARMMTPSTRSYTPSTRSYTPSTRSFTPSTRSFTPSTRSFTPSTRSFTPSTRSFAPSTRSFAPSTRSFAPSTRSFAPSMGSYHSGGFSGGYRGFSGGGFHGGGGGFHGGGGGHHR